MSDRGQVDAVEGGGRHHRVVRHVVEQQALSHPQRFGKRLKHRIGEVGGFI